MKIQKSTTGKFYVAIQSVGNNEHIGMGATHFEALQECTSLVYGEALKNI